jgi:hypothetical protein
VWLLIRDHALTPAGRIMKHTVWLLFVSGSHQHCRSDSEGFQKVLYILCNGMTMKMVMFAVNVRKIKALTVMEQWHWLVKADRIWHALCIMCKKLIADYFFFADVAFGGSSLFRVALHSSKYAIFHNYCFPFLYKIYTWFPLPNSLTNYGNLEKWRP